VQHLGLGQLILFTRILKFQSRKKKQYCISTSANHGISFQFILFLVFVHKFLPLNISTQQPRSSCSHPNTQEISFYCNRCGCLVTGRMPAELLGAACLVCLVVFGDGIFTSWTSTVSSYCKHCSACHCLLYIARACGQRHGMDLIYTRWWFHNFLTHMIIILTL
jgi:hypothetical protein